MHIREGDAAGLAGEAGAELSGLHRLAASFDVRTDAGQDKEIYAAQVCCRLVQRRDDISLPQMRYLLSLDDPLAALRDTWLELHSGDNEPVLKVILYKLCGEM